MQNIESLINNTVAPNVSLQRSTNSLPSDAQQFSQNMLQQQLSPNQQRPQFSPQQGIIEHSDSEISN